MPKSPNCPSHIKIIQRRMGVSMIKSEQFMKRHGQRIFRNMEENSSRLSGIGGLETIENYEIKKIPSLLDLKIPIPKDADKFFPIKDGLSPILNSKMIKECRKPLWKREVPLKDLTGEEPRETTEKPKQEPIRTTTMTTQTNVTAIKKTCQIGEYVVSFNGRGGSYIEIIKRNQEIQTLPFFEDLSNPFDKNKVPEEPKKLMDWKLRKIDYKIKKVDRKEYLNLISDQSDKNISPNNCQITKLIPNTNAPLKQNININTDSLKDPRRPRTREQIFGTYMNDNNKEQIIKLSDTKKKEIIEIFGSDYEDNNDIVEIEQPLDKINKNDDLIKELFGTDISDSEEEDENMDILDISIQMEEL
ncbi:unnamed protein product [Brachionus calyciflorus]|uniref:Uncharacterized protein n=1 Tax=Brachionus calyciflorus TaxID=104777 RepID=A0A814RN81_9BILA|nr:unnamed protein product [Brachionus calyciflorus]